LLRVGWLAALDDFRNWLIPEAAWIGLFLPICRLKGPFEVVMVLERVVPDPY